MDIIDYNKKIACFIHSTNLNMHKTDKIEYLINYLNKCKFFDSIDYCFINNIGEDINESFFNHVSNKIIINNYSEDTSLFENCTLKLLHFFSKLNPDYKILYIHTKGISYGKTHIYTSNINDWVNYMLYSLVDHHKSCIELLDRYDCVGVNYKHYAHEYDNPHHYSGNFWWANSNYICTLPVKILRIKHDAEWWLLKNNPNFLSIINFISGFYENSSTDIRYKDIIKHNLEYYKKNIINSCNIINLKISKKGGLSNQLNPIINCIFNIIHNKKYSNKKQIIIIDNFNKDYHNNIFCSIDEILDIDSINNYFKNYNIILIPANKIDFEIIKIEYGILGLNLFDITQKIKERYLVNGKYLSIPNYTQFNELKGDPLPLTAKDIYIYYKINGNIYMNTYFESRCNEISINLENETLSEFYLNTISAESKTNINLYNNILSNLKFLDKFYIYSNNIKNSISNYTKYSCIHLRNEDDSIHFWCMINNMDIFNFKQKLEDKYMFLIDKYLKPSNDEIIIILSSLETNNNVVDYLHKNNYNYLFLPKDLYREINAINDLLISKICNNIYIGNYNPNTFTGSTFSYIVSNNMNKNVRKVLIDLDQIDEPEFCL